MLLLFFKRRGAKGNRAGIVWQVILVIFFMISFSWMLYSYLGLADRKSRVYVTDILVPEQFDSSMVRLNSIRKIQSYCDSIVSEEMKVRSVNQQKCFSEVLARVLRYRFYHGYSFYGYKDNYFGKLFASLSGKDIDAIVLPEDILKFPNAACSQQSIVAMRILKNNRIPNRKVIFQGDSSGHFCYEAYYEGAWHFFDTNMEPDLALLQAYDRPSIHFLNSRTDILLQAYKHYPASKVLDIFSHYRYGEINESPAIRATIFQQVTKFLSHFSWIFFLIMFFIVRKRHLKSSR